MKDFAGRVSRCFAIAAAAALTAWGCRDSGRAAECAAHRRELARIVAQIQDIQLGLLVLKVQPEFIHYADIPRVLESGSVQYLHERNEKLIEIMENDAQCTSSEIERMNRILLLRREMDRVAELGWRRK